MTPRKTVRPTRDHERVIRDDVRATARGDGQLYRCGHVAGRSGGWFCTCEARTDRCAHLTALRLIVVRRSA